MLPPKTGPSRRLGLPKFEIPGNGFPSTKGAGSNKNAHAELASSFENVQQQMRNVPPTRFTPWHGAPSYVRAQETMSEKFGNWNVSKNDFGGYFMVFSKDTDIHTAYQGDKLHISTSREQVIDAYNTLAPLLMSIESPITNWKVSDMAHSHAKNDPNARTVANAQFTLYIKTDQSDKTYSPEHLQKLKELIHAIEETLKDAGVEESQSELTSDVRGDNWRFVSYRNEHNSSRDGSSEQQSQQREQAFFKLIA